MNPGMGGTDPLQQLRDLHLPAHPGWFPPAPGWWILALLLAVAVTVVVLRRIAQRRRRMPFRAARVELEQLRAAADAGQTTASGYAHGANAILKRVAIHGLRRGDAAPLSGDAWLDFLDGLDAAGTFRNGAGEALGDRRFVARAAVDHAALDACVRNLLERLERAA